MFFIGGVNCSQEFGDFLAANPTYTEIEDPGIGNLDFYNQIFICQDGGVRFYNIPQPTCIELITSFANTNPPIRGLTSVGSTALFGESDLSQPLTAFNPGSGYYRFTCTTTGEIYALYDPTIISSQDLAIINSNPSWII